MDSLVAEVVVPRPLDGTLSYLIPEKRRHEIFVGSLVEVPFRSGKTLGLVLEIQSRPVPEEYVLKEILQPLCNRPLFLDTDLKFLKWISEYYQLPMGEVFHSAFPKKLFSETREKPKVEEISFKLKPRTFELTCEQKAAIEKIKLRLRDAKYHSFLLFGVTGSGKTEVYLDAVAQSLSLGKSVLVMVPEIALTPQLRARFEERFGDLVAVLHSSLTEKRRREYWWDVSENRRKVVVGARSSLFAPLRNLGLIIVDEEHEPSYKQEDRLRYNARDLAMVRASIEKAVVILGSATPSIETFRSAEAGKHELLSLSERPLKRPLPEITIVDLKETRGNFLSDPLIAGLEQTLAAGEQSILFVNRKGFSSFLLCEACGHVKKCLNCSVSLTFYRNAAEVRCHYCAYQTRDFGQCEKCASPTIKFMGFGTERIEEEVRQRFPHLKANEIDRLDSDAASTAKKLEHVLKKFRDGETKILIGTQMIAKGHDFPNVTFIGIVLADLSLHFPDFRAAERTFQLLAQVAGRSGRAEKPGKVVLQTYMPEHYVIQAAAKQDYLEFYKIEIKEREELGYPPFSKMAQLEFRDIRDDRAQKQAMQVQRVIQTLTAESANDISYLGPAPASIARIANQYRWKILLKSEKTSTLNALIKTLRKSGVRFIDVDPVNVL